MLSRTHATQLTQRQAHPLCCRYLLLHFETVSTPVPRRDPMHHQAVRWALGVLEDGQYEVLGAWAEPEAGATGWEEVFQDLQVRGVEKTRFVIVNECSEVSAAVPTAYSGATVLPSTGQLLRQSLAQMAPRHRRFGGDALGAIREARTTQAARAVLAGLAASLWGATYPAVVERWRDAVEDLAPFYALSPRLRQLVLAGDEAAQRVIGTLQRAVARKRCFPSRAAAVTFISEVLDRVDLGFCTAGPAAGRGAWNHGQSLGKGLAPALRH